jgi:CheY-like chemotaxis protein
MVENPEHGMVAERDDVQPRIAVVSLLPSDSPPRGNVPTILVIDDDVPTLELLSAAFGLEGYRVVDAVNGREGMLRMETDHPDVVLCDVLMPEVDGRGFSEAMHAHAAFKNIPLVLVSAGQESRVAAGIECTAFVEKPFSVGALVALVKQLIDRSRMVCGLDT